MRRLLLRQFRGLDLRNLPSESASGTWRSATNVHLTTGRGAESRDPVRLFARVAPESRGLYVIDDKLRMALPYPAKSMPVPRPPASIEYDLLADQDGVGMKFPVEDIESVTAWDNRPFICARVTAPSGTKYRYYFIPDSQAAFSGAATAQVGNTITVAGLPAEILIGATVYFFNVVGSFQITARVGDDITLSPALPVLSPVAMSTFFWPYKNYVKVPFEPGPPVTTAAGKVFGADVLGRNVWFCSTEFGPTDWTAVDDAGFLPTSTNVDGDQPIRGLGVYRGQLTVFFATVAQTWKVDPDPANMAFVENIGGAGTLYPDSVENVSGDLFYFSNGAFRSLDAQVLTGQPKEGDIGAPIRELTRETVPARASAVWSAWRQQYICAFDNIVYVYTYSPVNQVYGWGRWVLPWPVSALVEWRQKLYVRRADADEVWIFDPEGSTPVDWEVKFNFTDCSTDSDPDPAGRVKLFKFAELSQLGTATMSYGFNPDDDTAEEDMFTLDAASTNIGKIAAVCVAEMVQPIFRGVGFWRLDNLAIRYDLGGML